MRRMIAVFCCIAIWPVSHTAAGQIAANTAPQNGVLPSQETFWIQTKQLRLKSAIYRSAKLSAHPVLVVVLHGDLLGVRAIPPSTYHYLFAQKAAGAMDDVVMAALLRPGYRDNTGEFSEGERGLTTGDNYTPEVVNAVAQAVEQLKARFHANRTVLVGHSGGAAITGDLIGQWPSEVNGALVISCPCDLEAWRQHMKTMQNNDPIWSVPIHSISPIDVAGRVSASVVVRLLVGSEDPVAPSEMSQHYAEELRHHDKNVTVTVVPGLYHDILLEPVTFDSLAALVQSLKNDPPATKKP